MNHRHRNKNVSIDYEFQNMSEHSIYIPYFERWSKSQDSSVGRAYD